MIDEIGGGLRVADLGVEDPVRLRDRRDVLRRAGQPDQAGMEVRDVIRQEVDRVAGGIHGYEERLYGLCPVAQLVERVGHGGGFGRADVGTVGVAEVDQQELAAVVGKIGRAHV